MTTVSIISSLSEAVSSDGSRSYDRSPEHPRYRIAAFRTAPGYRPTPLYVPFFYLPSHHFRYDGSFPSFLWAGSALMRQAVVEQNVTQNPSLYNPGRCWYPKRKFHPPVAMSAPITPGRFAISETCAPSYRRRHGGQATPGGPGNRSISKSKSDFPKTPPTGNGTDLPSSCLWLQ